MMYMLMDYLLRTLGKPRKHVWTYAAGHEDATKSGHNNFCLCAATPGVSAHSFIDNHFCCESGAAEIPRNTVIHCEMAVDAVAAELIQNY